MNRICLNGQPLDLGLTLSSGQAFRWRQSDNGVWQGVVRNKLMRVCRDGENLLWRTYPQDDLALVEDYFRLNDDVLDIYRELSARCDYLTDSIKRFYGLRLLRQEPTETLFSFVCSAANSIPRIMASIEAMCAVFGELVCDWQGVCYYSFPSAQKLRNAEEQVIRSSGSLGFRARHIQSVAAYLASVPEDWLVGLRQVEFSQARAQLVAIRGVGYKIADCVCLFALDKDQSVPVDTHIRQIGCRLFMPEMGGKCVTQSLYRRIQQEFLDRYGRYAGWAQQFLFYDDLTLGKSAESTL